jgi:hypothetical protein
VLATRKFYAKAAIRLERTHPTEGHPRVDTPSLVSLNWCVHSHTVRVGHTTWCVHSIRLERTHQVKASLEIGHVRIPYI